MAYVIAAPEVMTSAAGDLATIGSDLSAAHTAAAAPTTGVIPAAADEVSAGIARLFSRYGADFHALMGKATAFHEQFAQNLSGGARAYGSAEAVNIADLLSWLNTGVANTERNLIDLSQLTPQQFTQLAFQDVALGLLILLILGAAIIGPPLYKILHLLDPALWP